MSTLTMQDIANLAKVSRPAVTQWRNRPRVHGESIPFPAPVDTIGGVEHFRANEIVDWLARTGRGNGGADAALDAPAFAVPADIAIEDVVTLLAWHAMTGRESEGTSLSDRITAAVEVDVDDRILLREIRALDATPDLLAFTDQLVDASFGAEDALTRLERGRLGRARGARDVTPDGVATLRAVLDAALGHLDGDGVGLHAVGDAALALALCDSGWMLSTPGDDAGRAIRRRAAIREIDIDDDRRSHSVVVASLLGLDCGPALDVLDELVLDLSDGQIALIVGPGSVLADSLRGDAQSKRAGSIGVRNLVAALRLPRGLWREAHRQNIAVWICKGRSAPEMVHLGDIDRLADADLGDLTADIAGALAETARRSYRFTRRVLPADVAVASTVVPRGISAPVEHGTDSGDHIDRVHRATLRTSLPQEPLDVLVTPSRAGFILNRRSLGEMSERKELRVFRRSRIEVEHADPMGTVAVLPDAGIKLDPIDAERHYPRVVRTEVGDVVFVEKPTPRAWVDEEGGALVASPARILRLGASAVVGPNLIAAVINAIAPHGSEWRTWRIPIPNAQEAGRLEAALSAVADYEGGLRVRASAARELGAALIAGVATGALSIQSSDT